MRISDWSSDVCSSDLQAVARGDRPHHPGRATGRLPVRDRAERGGERTDALDGGLAGRRRQLVAVGVGRVAAHVELAGRAEPESIFRAAIAALDLLFEQIGAGGIDFVTRAVKSEARR